MTKQQRDQLYRDVYNFHTYCIEVLKDKGLAEKVAHCICNELNRVSKKHKGKFASDLFCAVMKEAERIGSSEVNNGCK